MTSPQALQGWPSLSWQATGNRQANSKEAQVFSSLAFPVHKLKCRWSVVLLVGLEYYVCVLWYEFKLNRTLPVMLVKQFTLNSNWKFPVCFFTMLNWKMADAFWNVMDSEYYNVYNVLLWDMCLLALPALGSIRKRSLWLYDMAMYGPVAHVRKTAGPTNWNYILKTQDTSQSYCLYHRIRASNDGQSCRGGWSRWGNWNWVGVWWSTRFSNRFCFGLILQEAESLESGFRKFLLRQDWLC